VRLCRRVRIAGLFRRGCCVSGTLWWRGRLGGRLVWLPQMLGIASKVVVDGGEVGSHVPVLLCVQQVSAADE
jgi:hypothetical protein